MKMKLLLFCCMGLAMLSCQTTDVLPEKDAGKVNLPVESVNGFTLVSDELVEEANGVELRSGSSYVSNYEQSIPIYRYYCHMGDKSDHYFGREAPSGTTRSIKSRIYTYEAQEFNLLNINGNQSTKPLYRYYSAALNDHMLSTGSVSGYTQDGGLLGYVFVTHDVGTVPLEEYYNAITKNHLYVVRPDEIAWLRTNDPNYQYVKTIGYVYPGARAFTTKTPSVIQFQSSLRNFPYNNPVSGYLYIKARETDNVYHNLTYSFLVGNNNGFENLRLPMSYKIVSMDIEIRIVPDDFSSPTLPSFIVNGYNITRPFYDPYGLSGDYHNLLLYKELNGYTTKYTLKEDIPVGITPIE